eukprot:SAG31_NODE_3372_length_4351_cov_4.835842_2_plen_101_part_00
MPCRLLFDTRIWHTALPNTSGATRDNVILNYCPFWHKTFGDLQAGASRLAAAGKLDGQPFRRQLLGLELATGEGTSQGHEGSNPYDAEWTEKHDRIGTRW